MPGAWESSLVDISLKKFVTEHCGAVQQSPEVFTTGHSKVVAGSQGTQDTDYSEVVEIRVGCMGQCYEFPPSIEMV